MTRQPNVILISADSLRADHLGCYGYSQPTSPQIDAMATRGALCENMFCPVIPTQPSHTTIFTGQHPLTHGVVAHGGKAKLGRGSPFLPELFLESGYTTCAVDTLFRERIWFGRGYEYILDPSIHHIFYAAVTQEELNQRALQWIETVPKGPFFMFIHYWDTHYPYVPPDRYRSMFYAGGNPTDPENHALDQWWDHPIGAMARDTWLRTAEGTITDPNYVTALYNGEIRYLDDGIGELFAGLDRLSLTEDTIVVLLADHGESMTEHRICYDHYGLYDSTVHVPFIMHWPGGRIGKHLRLPNFRQLSDVAPTLLEAADISIPEAMDGRSFFQQLKGQEAAQGYDMVVGLESTWQAKYCLRSQGYKFILAREPDLLGNPDRELYDLKSDPWERINLVESAPKLAGEMEKELEAWIAERLQASGRTTDPVRQEGASMVATWKAHRS